MSPEFPAAELRYIIQNSQSVVLISSKKFEDKARTVLKEGPEATEKKPTYIHLEKHMGVGSSEVKVEMRDVLSKHEGGMMLHTSGTTSRPVRTALAIQRNLS